MLYDFVSLRHLRFQLRFPLDFVKEIYDVLHPPQEYVPILTIFRFWPTPNQSDRDIVTYRMFKIMLSQVGQTTTEGESDSDKLSILY